MPRGMVSRCVYVAAVDVYGAVTVAKTVQGS
jgi:hypothetical protein